MTSQPPISITSTTETPALVAFDCTSSTAGAVVLIDHDPTALDADAAHFYLNCATFVGINEPASSRNDTVWTMGYNISPDGARVDTDEPALALHFENCYNQAGVDPNAAMEWHLQFTGTDNVGHRPLTAFLYRDGSASQFAFAATDITYYDWDINQRIKYDFSNPTATGIVFTYPTSMAFASNNTPTLTQKRSGAGYTTLIYLDSTNTITLTDKTQVLGPLTTSGSVSSYSFVPTAATVPTAGMFAPSGDLGFSVGSAERMHIRADGRSWSTGAKADLSYSKQTPATGFSITVSNTCGRLILDPTGTLAVGTITMPAAPIDGQILKISSTQVVTALTHNANTGQTLKGALTALSANGSSEYTYVASNTTWYRTN